MKRSAGTTSLRALVLILLILPLAVTAAAGAAKKPLGYDAYNGWRSIQGTQLSRDGQWLVYALVPQDGDGELVALNLKTNKEFRAARGKQPVVTVDGKFVVFTIAPPKADVDKAKKDKKKADEQPKPGLGILDLATGQVTTVDRVKSFKVPEESRRVRGLSPGAAAQEAGREEGRGQEGRGQEGARGEARGQTGGQAGRQARRREEGRGQERGEEERARQRPRRPRAGLRQRNEDRRGRRIRLEQARHLAGLRRLLQDPRERRRLRPRSGDGKDGRPSQGPRQLQEPDLRRQGRRSSPSPATATTTSRRSRPPSSTIGRRPPLLPAPPGAAKPAVPATAPSSWSPAAKGFPAGHGCERERQASVLQGRRSPVLRHRRRPQARAQGRARAGQGRYLELEGPLPPADAEGPGRGGQEADADVRRPLPAQGEEVRPAGHGRCAGDRACPRTPRCAVGSSDLALPAARILGPGL